MVLSHPVCKTQKLPRNLPIRAIGGGAQSPQTGWAGQVAGSDVWAGVYKQLQWESRVWCICGIPCNSKMARIQTVLIVFTIQGIHSQTCFLLSYIILMKLKLLTRALREGVCKERQHLKLKIQVWYIPFHSVQFHSYLPHKAIDNGLVLMWNFEIQVSSSCPGKLKWDLLSTTTFSKIPGWHANIASCVKSIEHGLNKAYQELSRVYSS